MDYGTDEQPAQSSMSNMPLNAMGGAEVVRIECYGCSATLEVGVPPLRDMLSQITQQQILSVPFVCISQSEPVVIRCGQCGTLLQVAITMQPSLGPLSAQNVALGAPYSQAYGIPQQIPQPGSGPDPPCLQEQITAPHPPLQRTFSQFEPGVGNLVDSSTGEDGGGKEKKVKKKPKRSRQPSAYNHFMRDEIERVKNEHGVEHKVAFRMAAQAWKWHPMNAANRSLGRTEPEKQYSDNEQRQQEANNQEPQKVLEQESGQLKMQGSREESEREGVTEVSSAECQQ